MGGIRVELHPYDPDWPARYDDEASRISAVLGDRVLLLAHVGSTAVPGLAAKPIIDVVSPRKTRQTKTTMHLT